MIASVSIHQFVNGYVVGVSGEPVEQRVFITLEDALAYAAHLLAPDPDIFHYEKNEVCFVEKVVSQ